MKKKYGYNIIKTFSYKKMPVDVRSSLKYLGSNTDILKAYIPWELLGTHDVQGYVPWKVDGEGKNKHALIINSWLLANDARPKETILIEVK